MEHSVTTDYVLYLQFNLKGRNGVHTPTQYSRLRAWWYPRSHVCRSAPSQTVLDAHADSERALAEDVQRAGHRVHRDPHRLCGLREILLLLPRPHAFWRGGAGHAWPLQRGTKGALSSTCTGVLDWSAVLYTFCSGHPRHACTVQPASECRWLAVLLLLVLLQTIFCPASWLACSSESGFLYSLRVRHRPSPTYPKVCGLRVCGATRTCDRVPNVRYMPPLNTRPSGMLMSRPLSVGTAKAMLLQHWQCV